MRQAKTGSFRYRLGLLGLGFLTGLSVSGCERPTVGFCEVDDDCSAGSYCALPAQACTEATVIRAELFGGQQVPPTASDATGSFKMVISADGTSGAYTLTHTVKNANLMAELRAGKVGQGNMAARALLSLPASQQSGTLALDQDLISSITSGEVYMVLFSQTFMTGEIRGQLFSIDPKHASGIFKLSGTLSGLQSAPANISAGHGSIDITYDDAAGTVAYNYSIAGLPGKITAIHLHRGAFNVNGPQFLDMPGTESASGGVLTHQDGCNQYKDQCQIFPVLLKSSLGYFNVHTSDFAKGELRAQVQVGTSLPFNSPLSTKGITPMVSSSALGEVHFYLSEDKTRLAFRIEHNAANPTAIELTKLGSTGAIVAVPCATLTASQGVSGAQGYCDVGTDGTAKTLQLSDLLGGMLTVTLKTTQNPNGELRGDVRVPMK